MRLAHDYPPLRKGCGALGFAILAVTEAAFLVEMVVDLSVDRAEFLQRMHLSKPQHRPLPSSERLV